MNRNFRQWYKGMKQRHGELRTDTGGFNTAAVIGLVVGLVISILVALALLPSIAGSEYVAANNASLKLIPTASSLLPLVLILTVVTIAVMPIGALLYMLRE